MNTHNIELPAEFRSGNDIPVTQATIKRERMEEILRDSIEADRKRQYRPVYEEGWKDALEWVSQRRGEPSALLARIAELEAQLEAVGAGGVTQSQPLMPSRTPEISENSEQLDAGHD